MKHAKNDYNKSLWAKAARHSLHCAIYQRCGWVGNETEFMSLWRNEEMRKWADKYTIEELDEARSAGKALGSLHGTFNGCPEFFFE